MDFGSTLIRDTRSTQRNGTRSEQRRRRGSNSNGRIIILGLNGKPNVNIFTSVAKVKLTGASSSAGCVGELECMKGATSIIDFFSMPETVFDFVYMLKNHSLTNAILIGPRNFAHLGIEQTRHLRLQY